MTLLVSAEAEAYRVRCLRMETPYDPLWCCCAEWFDYWDESVPVADGPHAVACEGCKYDRPTSRSASVKSVPGGIDGTTPRLLETPDTRVSEDPPLEPVARLDRRATSTDVPPAPGAARALTRHDGGTGPTSPSLPAGFWARIDATGDCWEWTGKQTAKGYGQYTTRTKTWRAHRAAYQALVGPIPETLTLDHLCRNRLCVNPDHLEPIDNRTNILRGHSPSARHARQTACIRGHVDWTRLRDGKRRCQTCHLNNGRASRAGHRPAARRAQRLASAVQVDGQRGALGPTELPSG